MQENASMVFEKAEKKQLFADRLYRETGQLKVELDFLSGKSEAWRLEIF
jgi:hypothetical protein